MSKTARVMLKFALGAVGIIVVAVIASIVAVNVSPRPFAWLTKKMFEGGVGKEPADMPLYREMTAKVAAEREIEYPSTSSANRLDVFRPKDAQTPLPTRRPSSII